MKNYNQYSDDIRRYNEEHGTDIFIEYKDPNTTEERKAEIVKWMFDLIRGRNEVPIVTYDDMEIYQAFASLSEVNSEEVYHDGAYWFNNTAITVLSSFFPEMLDVSKKRRPSVNKLFYQDWFLRRLIRKTLLYCRSEVSLSTMFSFTGAGYCSNFRPACAKAIYELFGKKKDCRVFDSSSGYGARLLGAHFAENVVEYLGIDPNTADSCSKEIEFLKKWCDTNTKETVLKMGSEDFTIESFPQYKEYFDLYFTSPPYFDTEMYSDDETQSYKKFPTYAQWVKGFYRSTIYNACDVLKKDGIFIINIFEKIPKIKEMTKLILADCGYYVFKEDKYLLVTMSGTTYDEDRNVIIREKKTGERYEPVWYAKHYFQLLDEGVITKEQAESYKKRAIRCFKDADS